MKLSFINKIKQFISRWNKRRKLKRKLKTIRQKDPFIYK